MRISDWSSDVCSSDLNTACNTDDKGIHIRGCFEKLYRGFGFGFGKRCGGGGAQSQAFEQELVLRGLRVAGGKQPVAIENRIGARHKAQIGRASCRERVCQYV